MPLFTITIGGYISEGLKSFTEVRDLGTPHDMIIVFQKILLPIALGLHWGSCNDLERLL